MRPGPLPPHPSSVRCWIAQAVAAAWLALTGRERLAQRQCWGLLLGLAGVGLVVRGAGLDFGWAQLSGNLLALGAAGAWAWYGLAIGPLVAAVGSMRATGWTMLAAGLLFIPLSFPEARAHPWGSVSLQAWAGLVYGATLGMVVAMALWGRSIHRLGPERMMVYAYLEPASAVAIAAILLGESLSSVQAVGALLALAGVWLAS